MNDSGLMPIRFYAEFARRDWPALPRGAQDALAAFLLRLQKEPNNPEILRHAARDMVGRFAYEFSCDYTVHWQFGQGLEGFDLSRRIEVLALRKNEIAKTETPDTPTTDTSTTAERDRLQKMFSRTKRLDNLVMWGSLHVSSSTGKLAGWIVDSWSEGGPPYLRARMHWVSYPDHKLHYVQLKIDFSSAMVVGPEDSEGTDDEMQRQMFIRATVAEWEKEWLASSHATG